MATIPVDLASFLPCVNCGHGKEAHDFDTEKCFFSAGTYTLPTLRNGLVSYEQCKEIRSNLYAMLGLVPQRSVADPVYRALADSCARFIQSQQRCSQCYLDLKQKGSE